MPGGKIRVVWEADRHAELGGSFGEGRLSEERDAPRCLGPRPRGRSFGGMSG
jgi:hypothetical protein